MNEVQRTVLQRHFRQLASDLILTDNLYAALYQHRIFERNMIDLIKSEKTEGEQVYKMLEMLPKRGPDAFDTFVNIIQHDYPWLAAMLNSSQKQEASSRAPTRGDPYKFDNDIRASVDLETDTDIKSKVSMFIHKQFGQSKRISENDKKTMVRWLSQQLQTERRRAASASSQSYSTVITSTKDKCVGTENSDLDLPNLDLSKRVQQLCGKLQEYRHSGNCKVSTPYDTQDIQTPQTQEGKPRPSTRQDTKLNGKVKPPMTPGSLELLLSDVEGLLEKVDMMEKEINKCYVMIGSKDKTMSLSLLIYDVALKSKNLDKEAKEEKAKSEKMLTELYEYSSKITRLEQANLQQKAISDNHATEIDRLHRDVQNYKDKILQYEQMMKLHTEKQNTLENLKTIVRDIQKSKVTKDGIKSVSSRTSAEIYGRSVGGRPSISRYSSTKPRGGARSIVSGTSNSSSQQMISRKYGTYGRVYNTGRKQ